MNRADFFIINNSFSQGFYTLSSLNKANSNKAQNIKFDETVPLMDVPPTLDKMAINSYLLFTYGRDSVIGIKTITTLKRQVVVKFYVPALDTFGTEFIQIAMRIKYTLRAIDFISSKTGSLSQLTNSDKISLGASLDPAKIMSKESYGTYSAQYEKSLQKALIFHVELGKKYILNDLLFNLIEEYSERILGAEFEHKGKIYKVDKENINRLFGNWMGDINKYLDEHFDDLEKRWGKIR